ncbi:MAG: RNA polymerase sigma factor [Phycisphaerae bacterium]
MSDARERSPGGGMDRAEEQRLVKLAAKGDHDAATTLIRAHQRSVFAYIRRLCGRDDIAEDTTQEAFARVLLNLDRFDPRFRFSTWLFTIARRVMLNITAKMHPVYDSEHLDESQGRADASGAAMERRENNEKARDLLQAALMTLPPSQREVVVLFHQHDWPIWMIAEQMGIPEGTVKSHLFRARVKLRDEYLRLERIEAARRAPVRRVQVNERSAILMALHEEPPTHAANNHQGGANRP